MSRPAGTGSPRFRPIVNADREDYERLMAEMTTPAARYITPDRRGIDPAVLCEGYHWNLCRCLAQAQEWEDLKHHIDIIKFDYLKKEIKWTIQTASPRLYARYWPEHDGVERPLTA